MSKKTHPKFQYYFQKYPIPNKLLKEYETYIREKKFEDKEDDIDRSKIGNIKLEDSSHTHLARVAREGLSNFHVLIAVNPEECNKDFNDNISNLYNKTNIHVCIMGKGAREIGSNVSKEISTLMILEAVEYNYSLAINVLLKQVSDKLPLSTVALCDGWSIFSPIQVIQKEFTDFDWDNNFVVIDNSYDYIEDPINLKEDKKHLIQHTYQRLTTHKNPGTAIPIVISKTSHLVDIENGLEEEFFTEYSRIHVINQLETAGLTKVTSKNGSLCIRKRRDITLVEQKDFRTIKDIRACEGYFVFIPSNYKTQWGMADKIGILEIDSNNIPFWKYKTQRPNIRNMYDLNKIDTPITTKTQDSLWVDKLNNVEFEIDPNSDILLLVNSTIPELLSSTPLIRRLYEKYGEINVLTDDKLNPINALIKNFMVKKIYDANDFKYKMFSLKNYGANIIKTADCNVDVLDKITDIVEAPDTYEDLITRNYSIVDPISKTIPNPFCNFKISNEKIPPDSVAISISVLDPDIVGNRPTVKQLGVVCSRLANNSNIHVLLLVLPDEKKLLDTSAFKVRKNIHIYEKNTHFHLSGLINKCKVLITTSNSDALWLSWGLKKNTIVLNTSECDFIPEYDYINTIQVEASKPLFQTKSTANSIIDKTIKNVWKYL